MRVTPSRDRAARYVVSNWRVRKRLPHITRYAVARGFITSPDDGVPTAVHCHPDCRCNHPEGK